MVFESQFWRRYCQTFSTGFSSGAREGNQIGVMLAGIFSSGVVCQPASRQRKRCAEVEDENGVRAGSDIARDFVDVELHRLGVGERERQGRAFAESGADRAEQIGVLVALIGGLPGPGSAPRPLAHETGLSGISCAGRA
jgi:hypothetical protein